MKAILSILIIITITSCASKKEELDVQAKAKESRIHDSKGLGDTISDLIHSSKTLSDAQKKELENIFMVNKQRADSLSEQSYKFRSVLIRELLSGKINKTDVEVIKKDIEKIETEKLRNTFDTVEKITNIVSAHPEKNKYIDHLLFIERPAR